MVWDLKGQEGNLHADRKANRWRVNVCWAIFISEYREDVGPVSLARFLHIIPSSH